MTFLNIEGNKHWQSISNLFLKKTLKWKEVSVPWPICFLIELLGKKIQYYFSVNVWLLFYRFLQKWSEIWLGKGILDCTFSYQGTFCESGSNIDLWQGTNTAQKWSFSLRISSATVTRSTVSCGFGHIYWRDL